MTEWTPLTVAVFLGMVLRAERDGQLVSEDVAEHMMDLCRSAS